MAHCSMFSHLLLYSLKFNLSVVWRMIIICVHLGGNILNFSFSTQLSTLNQDIFIYFGYKIFLIKICVSICVCAGRRAQIQCSQNSPCCFYSILSCHVHQRHGGVQTGWDRHAGHGPQVKIQTSETIKISTHALLFCL